MFVFFSNRLGCVGSLLVTLALSALLFMLMRGLQQSSEYLLNTPAL